MRQRSRFRTQTGFSKETTLICAVLIFGAAKAAQGTDCVPALTAQPPTDSLLTPGQVGVTYFTSFQMTSGVSPFTVSSSPSAPLPSGLSVGPSSLSPSIFNIFGTPQDATVGGTFIIHVQDHTGCTTDIVYAISINAAPACNPPPKLMPAGGELEPIPATGADWEQQIAVEGGTGPYTSETSGNPPSALSLNLRNFSALPNDGAIDVHLTPPAVPGTYTFTVTVTDSRGCKATGNYTITIVGTGAGCVIQVRAPHVVQARVGVPIQVPYTAANIGDAPCVGGTFTVTLGPGLPPVSTTPGSAFPMFCNLVSGQEHCGGAGTIPARGFAGLSTSLVLTTPGVIQVPSTLQFVSGPSQQENLVTTSFFDGYDRRDVEHRLSVELDRLFQGGIIKR